MIPNLRRAKKPVSSNPECFGVGSRHDRPAGLEAGYQFRVEVVCRGSATKERQGLSALSFSELMATVYELPMVLGAMFEICQ
jgi:hypothetical protein